MIHAFERLEKSGGKMQSGKEHAKLPVNTKLQYKEGEEEIFEVYSSRLHLTASESSPG